VPRAGDQAIGFLIDLQRSSTWDVNRDQWSAIFNSPAVGNWSSFEVQMRSDAPGLLVLAFAEVRDPATGTVKVVLLKASKDQVHWTTEVELAGSTPEDGWHTYYFDSANTELAPGSIHAVHLEVFGPVVGLDTLQGKRILIDQVSGR
jgi:hypothetical protein